MIAESNEFHEQDQETRLRTTYDIQLQIKLAQMRGWLKDEDMKAQLGAQVQNLGAQS